MGGDAVPPIPAPRDMDQMTTQAQAESARLRPAVTMRGITKRFPGVVANDQVDFEAAEGEVHALLGENGAGKSTLSSILTGLYRADEGELALWGQPVHLHSPREALELGVFMVHQHFRLVSPFTVAENIILGDHREAGRAFRLRPRVIEEHVEQLCARYGLAVEARARVWQLSVGEQQRVEILKALYREARILVLDEPTAVLTPQEAAALFKTMRAMAEEGRTVIFISHKLREVMAVADRVTVLRGGRSIATVTVSGATLHSLAALMVGRDVEGPRREKSAKVSDDVVLAVEGLSAGPLLLLTAIRGLAVEMIERYDVKAPGPGTRARDLSGGNLQKLVLAREFSGEPQVLVAASPTRGLDVGAIETVHAYIRDAAANGVAVLLISEDLDEILALADRVAVMYEGAIVGETMRAEASVEEIGLLMAGGRDPRAD